MEGKTTHDVFDVFMKAYTAFKRKSNDTNIMHGRGNGKSSTVKINCKVCGTEWIIPKLLFSSTKNNKKLEDTIFCSGCNRLYVIDVENESMKERKI